VWFRAANPDARIAGRHGSVAWENTGSAEGIMLKLGHAVFMQTAGQPITQPVQAVIYGWGQYKDQVSRLPKPEQDKIDQLADQIVSSFAQSALAPYRSVLIVGHADKDWQGPAVESSVAFNRAQAVQ